MCRQVDGAHTGAARPDTFCRCKRVMAKISLLSAGRCTLSTRPLALHSSTRLCRSGLPIPARLRHHQSVDRAQLSTPNCVATCNSGRHQRCGTALHATLQGGLVAEPQSSGGARELLTWISELPWPRVAIWLTVALTASQFHDFFGVGFGCTATFTSYLNNGVQVQAQACSLEQHDTMDL